MTLYVEMRADGTVPLDFAVSRNRPFALTGSYARAYEMEQDYDEALEYHAWAVPDAHMPNVPPAKEMPAGTRVFLMVAWEETGGFTVEVHPDFVSAYGAGLAACGAIDGNGRFAPQSPFFYTMPGETTAHTRHWWLVGDRMTENDDGAVYGHVVEVPVW